MRAVVQRVSEAEVRVGGEVAGRVGRGLLVLLGVKHSDDAGVARKLAEKVAELRIFEDAGGKMNLGLADVSAEVLCVSQFTLYGEVRRGRRPSFDEAARPEQALPLWEAFCEGIERGNPLRARPIRSGDAGEPGERRAGHARHRFAGAGAATAYLTGTGGAGHRQRSTPAINERGKPPCG